MDISSAPMYQNYEFRDSAIPFRQTSDHPDEKTSLRWPASPDPAHVSPKWKAAWLGMRLVLKNYHGMFMCRKIVTDAVLDKAEAFVKSEIKLCATDLGHRTYLANSGDLWTLLTDVFEIGTRVLRLQSFPDAPTFDEHGCSFSNFMASNHVTLMKDLERLTDLLTLARNMLVSTSIVQEAAASAKFDLQVLQVVDACVRVTSRGYDGELADATESKWATIVAAYKKMTVTSLQWLHNFVMHNEQRKLHLWNQLFGDFQPPENDAGAYEPGELEPLAELCRTTGVPTDKDFDPYQFQESPALKVMDEVIRSLRGYCQQTMRHIPEYPADFPQAQYGSFLVSVLQSVTAANGLCGDGAPNFSTLPTAYFRNLGDEEVPASELCDVTGPEQAARDIIEAKEKVLSEFLVHLADTDRTEYWQSPALAPQRMARSASTGVPGLAPVDQGQDHLASPLPVDQRIAEEVGQHLDEEDDYNDVEEEEEEDDEEDEADEEDEEEEEEGSEDEIGSATRGLLTEIPLVLGPAEIEALPLMIQSAVRSPPDATDTWEVHTMQALRCYRMISESSGRNLLRELLIFIAAWDLQEQETFFKLMVNIMEAILNYGLMPYAFTAFGEDKDVVSPAQSILIKLLTQIFRRKQAEAVAAGGGRPRTFSIFPAPPNVDHTIVRYIFMVFRTHIIPQTCALIYLQGQIRQGKVLPEDFPLNLWDMERVYEGVYQFLEFFAVLTESEAWKSVLVKEEIVFELITLLRELDVSIPKSADLQPPQTVAEAQLAAQARADALKGYRDAVGTETLTLPVQQEGQGHALGGQQQQQQPSAAVAVTVERPYDPSPPSSISPVGVPTFPTPAVAPLPAHANAPLDAAPISDSASVLLGENIEPADFEWRNLKKLVVLVLSSLVWKSRTVQDQIRAHGGVEMILNCCYNDGNNPYIKDHAVMCLRFLLDGSRENTELVRRIEDGQRREELRRQRERGKPTRVSVRDGRILVERMEELEFREAMERDFTPAQYQAHLQAQAQAQAAQVQAPSQAHGSEPPQAF